MTRKAPPVEPGASAIPNSVGCSPRRGESARHMASRGGPAPRDRNQVKSWTMMAVLAFSLTVIFYFLFWLA
jgi:hypothetical protein